MQNSSTGKSQKLLKKVKKSRYMKIFEGLIPDSDGFISKETVYKSVLSEDIKHVIKPLIDELEDLEEFLNFDEFFHAMENLMKTLSPAEKSVLLKTSKPKPQPEVYDFKPKTNFSRPSTCSPVRCKTPNTEALHEFRFARISRL